MKRETYELLKNYMLSCTDGSAHDREHVYRVLFTALDIARAEGCVDFDVLIAACLLHDIGRREQAEDPSLCHAQAGAEKAKKFLAENGFSEEFSLHVADCIMTHRFRKTMPPASVEARILFDADKLDVTGAIGVARTLMYRSQVEEPLYTLTEDGKISDGCEGSNPSFFQEYHFKLEKLYSGFLTDTGRKMAEERRDAAVSFYESLLRETRRSRDNGPDLLSEYLE